MTEGRIDIHMHICPSSFHGALTNLNVAGPPCSTSAGAVDALKALNVSKAIFSCSVPGPSVAGSGAAGRELARACNRDCLEFVKGDPEKLFFFAATPSWVDVEGTLAEIDFALVENKLPGVVVMATYEDKLLGDPMFVPIWDRLNALGAIVFIHPTISDIKPPLIAGKLQQFVADFPHQTTRNALDLVLSGTVTTHPDVKIILPHAGGTLPYLADKVLASCAPATSISRDEIKAAFSSFYFDVALSTGRIPMRALLDFAKPDRVLFGSDCTLCTPTDTPKEMADQLDKFLDTEEGKVLAGVISGNAEKLFKGKL
ncbi:amidohydrolase 2 [Hymenopellis radicata]|nr:amidohydrolase 2 [Hymenopellis radicata]